MTRVTRTIGAEPDEVFGVLSDGWSYASWVVGAAHMRDVDDRWPHVGARLSHRVGPWPVNVDDTTIVTGMTPDRELELDAHVWPFGAATVRMTLRPVPGGRTKVIMDEALKAPLGRYIPDALQALLIGPRNRESLARLDDLATHGYLDRAAVRSP